MKIYDEDDCFFSVLELEIMGIERVGRRVKIHRSVCLNSPNMLFIGDNVEIKPFCILCGDIVLESNSVIGEFSYLNGSVIPILIKNDVILYQHVVIESRKEVYKQPLIIEQGIHIEAQSIITRSIMQENYMQVVPMLSLV